MTGDYSMLITPEEEARQCQVTEGSKGDCRRAAARALQKLRRNLPKASSTPTDTPSPITIDTETADATLATAARPFLLASRLSKTKPCSPIAKKMCVTRCCGAHLGRHAAVEGSVTRLGSHFDFKDGRGLLFPSKAINTDNITVQEASFYSPYLLSSTLRRVLCRNCNVVLGFQWAGEPEEKHPFESWAGKYLLCSSFINLVHPEQGAEWAGDETDNADASPSSSDVCERDLPAENTENTLQSDTPQSPVSTSDFRTDEILCACGNLLSEAKHLLSVKSMWSTRSVERAGYFNYLHPDSFSLGKPEPRMVPQGCMLIAPLRCSCCGEEVGWKFVSQLRTECPERLAVYEGRFGLMSSKVPRLQAMQKDFSRFANAIRAVLSNASEQFFFLSSAGIGTDLLPER
ncbi:hypothetical protein DIPPA_34901 [Diplonema papillatum]|nr:hypothetical protein DIPPA_34901 [Diplonema papillatum]